MRVYLPDLPRPFLFTFIFGVLTAIFGHFFLTSIIFAQNGIDQLRFAATAISGSDQVSSDLGSEVSLKLGADVVRLFRSSSDHFSQLSILKKYATETHGIDNGKNSKSVVWKYITRFLEKIGRISNLPATKATFLAKMNLDQKSFFN